MTDKVARQFKVSDYLVGEREDTVAETSEVRRARVDDLVVCVIVVGEGLDKEVLEVIVETFCQQEVFV